MEAMTPIDIMLPFYGDVGLLQQTVRSVLSQDDPCWRLTVVDDGYPDDSLPGWFDKLGDARVQYLRNKVNLGANANYRKCLELAEAELMVMMGADDLMLPSYVRTVRSAHQAYPKASIIQPGVEVIDEHGAASRNLVDWTKKAIYQPKLSVRTVMSGEDLAVSLLRGDWLYFPSLCWRTDAVKTVGFRQDLHVVQDLALVIDLVQRGDEMIIDPGVCFKYRRHSASDSSVKAVSGARFIEERNYFVDVAERMRAQGWGRAASVAQLHLSSRLHALTRLPAAVKLRNTEGIRNLSRHAFGPSTHVSARYARFGPANGPKARD
jgi:glycosyltransferase involved in cell wall biosynthesis